MKLLLLVQNESDVAHLDAASKAILNSSITGVWVVFSPAITVNASEAAAKLDAEIAQLKNAERQSADRSDYAAAAGYKVQREGKELERGKALHDAWKMVNAEERKTKTQSIFAPFIANLKPNGLNVRITGHSDHYDREQWVAMLNSLSGVWFKEFSAGGFLVGWPEAVETSLKLQQATPQPPPPTPEITKEQQREYDEKSRNRLPKVPTIGKPITQEQIDGAPKSRREELEALHPMKLGPLMRSMGLVPEGKTRAEKIEIILAGEASKIEPALAEY